MIPSSTIIKCEVIVKPNTLYNIDYKSNLTNWAKLDFENLSEIDGFAV